MVSVARGEYCISKAGLSMMSKLFAARLNGGRTTLAMAREGVRIGAVDTNLPGIYNHENLDFTGLIADRKYQFVYIFSPAPIKGATGSNGCPIAVT